MKARKSADMAAWLPACKGLEEYAEGEQAIPPPHAWVYAMCLVVPGSPACIAVAKGSAAECR